MYGVRSTLIFSGWKINWGQSTINLAALINHDLTPIDLAQID